MIKNIKLRLTVDEFEIFQRAKERAIKANNNEGLSWERFFLKIVKGK